MSTSEHNNVVDERDVDRFIFFTDAIFAVAMTLLLIDIALPNPLLNLSIEGINVSIDPHPVTHNYHVTIGANGYALVNYIKDRIGNYTASFAIIASFWILHNRLFRSIKRIPLQVTIANLVITTTSLC